MTTWPGIMQMTRQRTRLLRRLWHSGLAQQDRRLCHHLEGKACMSTKLPGAAVVADSGRRIRATPGRLQELVRPRSICQAVRLCILMVQHPEIKIHTRHAKPRCSRRRCLRNRPRLCTCPLWEAPNLAVTSQAVLQRGRLSLELHRRWGKELHVSPELCCQPLLP